MRVKFIIIFLLLIILILSAQNKSFSHQVNVFAYRENGFLIGEGYYRGGRPAENAKVEIFVLNNNDRIGETQTDEEGKFSFKMERVETLKIVIKAGQGHRAEFVLEQESQQTTKQRASEAHTNRVDFDTEIRYLIDEKIRPLERRIRNIEKKQTEPQMRNILSGIGWILGIFTLIYLIKKKNAF